MTHLVSFLDSIPPKVCRIIARKGNSRAQRLMTLDDIAKASGISRRAVVYISKMKTWRMLKADFIERFSVACGVNLAAPSKKQLRQFVYRRAKAILNNATTSERKMIENTLAEFGINVVR